MTWAELKRLLCWRKPMGLEDHEDEVTGEVRTVVYVSGPYSRPNPNHNTKKAIEVADELLARGFCPIVPHLSHLWDTLSPKSWQDWLDYDLSLIRSAGVDAMLRLPGESAGADLETALAAELGIPVFHEIPDLVEWWRKHGVRPADD